MATPLSPLALGIPRPVSTATGLPMGVEELARTNADPRLLGTGLPPGVEQKAKEQRMQFTGPMPVNTVVNGILPNGTSARMPEILAGNQTAAPTPVSAPPVTQFLNPLSRGAAAGAASSLGGPVPVGGGNRSRGARLLERLARHGNATAAATLFQAEQGAAERAANQNFTRELDQTRGARDAAAGVLDFQRRRELEESNSQQRGRLQEDAQAHELDVLQFQDGARTRATQAEIEAHKGFNVVPLVPGEPAKGSAVLRGNGELFNLIPGTKPEEGMREYPDGVVQFPGDNTPYRREEVTPPFQGIPFALPKSQVTFTPLDFVPRENQPRVTQIEGPMIQDKLGNPTPGPKKTVIVDPKTGKAKPVKVEGETEDKKDETPTWNGWLQGNTSK